MFGFPKKKKTILKTRVKEFGLWTRRGQQILTGVRGKQNDRLNIENVVTNWLTGGRTKCQTSMKRSGRGTISELVSMKKGQKG